MNGKRLAYIDALKGILIMFVLFQHALYLSIGMEHPLIFEVFNLTAMPTFFFLSGYLFNDRQIDCLQGFYRHLIKISRRLLLPTLSCAITYLLIHNCISPSAYCWTIFDVFTDANWQGYWFTPTLFVISFVTIVIRFLLCRNLFVRLNLFILLFSPFVAHFVWRELGPISNIFCIRKMIEYFPFYSLGILANNYRGLISDNISKKLTGGVILTICVICILYVLYIKQHNVENYILFCYVRLLPAILIFAIFQKLSKIWDRDSIFVRIIRYIGLSSLCIYLLHYFFLPRNLQFLKPLVKNNIPLQIALGGTISFLLVLLVLGIVIFLRRSRIASFVLLGEKK